MKHLFLIFAVLLILVSCENNEILKTEWLDFELQTQNTIIESDISVLVAELERMYKEDSCRLESTIKKIDILMSEYNKCVRRLDSVGLTPAVRDSVIKYQELLTDSIYVSDKYGSTNIGLLRFLHEMEIPNFETSRHLAKSGCMQGTRDVLSYSINQNSAAGDIWVLPNSAVSPKCRKIFRDSSFNAEIYFAIVDTCRITELFIEEKKHQAEANILYYKEKAEKSVRKTGYRLSGIDWCRDTIKSKFTIEYEVVK